MHKLDELSLTVWNDQIFQFQIPRQDYHSAAIISTQKWNQAAQFWRQREEEEGEEEEEEEEEEVAGEEEEAGTINGNISLGERNILISQDCRNIFCMNFSE